MTACSALASLIYTIFTLVNVREDVVGILSFVNFSHM